MENRGNIMSMIKQVQQYMETTQSQLKEQIIEVHSGNIITVLVNGQQEIVGITIQPEYLVPETAPLLESLLTATINEALTQAKELHQSAVNQLTNSLHLPKIPGLF